MKKHYFINLNENALTKNILMNRYLLNYKKKIYFYNQFEKLNKLKYT